MILVPIGVICVHGIVICPWRNHLAPSTRRQHPEEKHRWLHRQVCKQTHLYMYRHTDICSHILKHNHCFNYLLSIITLAAYFSSMSGNVCVHVLCRHIAELIFYMEELRAHVRKYGPVMQRYYVQYLSGFDAVVLNELVQVIVHSQTSKT